MNPFNRPRSNVQSDELISPRTIPHNHNATHNNNSIPPSTKVGSSRSHHPIGIPYLPRQSHHIYSRVRRLHTSTFMMYTGTTLGKRPKQNYIRCPSKPKRRCTTDLRVNPEPALPIPYLAGNYPPYPNPAYHYNLPPPPSTAPSAGTAIVKTLTADPDLSLLPISPSAFTRIVWPPNPLPAYITATGGFGNELTTAGSIYNREFERDAIHPLFRKMLLPMGGYGQSYSYYTHVAMPGLWRVLMLATRLLSERGSLAFFHRLVFGDCRRLERESGVFGAEILHLDDADAAGLTEQQRVRTTDMLAALASHIGISFGTEAGCEGVWAHTKRVPTQDPNSAYVRRLNDVLDGYQRSCPAMAMHGRADTKLPYEPSYLQPLTPTPASLSRDGKETHDFVMRSQDHNLIHTRSVSRNEGFGAFTDDTHRKLPLLQGTNAAITLNPLFLRYLHRDTHPKVHYHAKVYINFFLAITLVHEVAHAVWMCRQAPQGSTLETMDMDGKQEDYEPFVGDHRKSELGKAWETSVFGGYGNIEPLGQMSGASDAAVEWGDVFMMGLGCRRWPDESEFFVEIDNQKRPGKQVVPLARLYQEPESGNQGEVPIPLSGTEFTHLKILPFDLVYNFFDARFWDWVEQRPESLSELMKLELDRFVEVKRENVEWMCVQGARAVDFDQAYQDRMMSEDDTDDSY